MATRNSKLTHISDEELQAELERRKQEAQEAQKPPKPLATPDWAKFQKFIEESIAELAKPDGYVKDFTHYVFEEALTTVYGRNFWDWWNEGPGNRE
jgi:hypothetical protein